MCNFTFLDENQVFGNNELEILKKYGRKAAITDFSILLGGNTCNLDFNADLPTFFYQFITREGERTGTWWTKTCKELFLHRIIDSNGAVIVGSDGFPAVQMTNSNEVGARPALSYSSIRDISSNRWRNSYGILELEYGEYPQTIAPENVSCKLEKVYNKGSLRPTGKKYTNPYSYIPYFDSDADKYYIEYEYNENKYIRFIGTSGCDGKFLSDGRTIQTGKAYWVCIEPLVWLVDEKTNIALSKKIIFSGVLFTIDMRYKGDFEDTDINNFMNRCFSKEIIPSTSRELILEEKEQTNIRRRTKKKKLFNKN